MTEPIIIDTAMRYLNIKWNRDGSLLAVTGMQYGKSSQGENKEVCVLQIYDAYGKVKYNNILYYKYN